MRYRTLWSGSGPSDPSWRKAMKDMGLRMVQTDASQAIQEGFLRTFGSITPDWHAS